MPKAWNAEWSSFCSVSSAVFSLLAKSTSVSVRFSLAPEASLVPVVSSSASLARSLASRCRVWAAITRCARASRSAARHWSMASSSPKSSVRARIGIEVEEICRQHCWLSGSVIEVSERSGSTSAGGCEAGSSEVRPSYSATLTWWTAAHMSSLGWNRCCRQT